MKAKKRNLLLFLLFLLFLLTAYITLHTNSSAATAFYQAISVAASAHSFRESDTNALLDTGSSRCHNNNNEATTRWTVLTPSTSEPTEQQVRRMANMSGGFCLLLLVSDSTSRPHWTRAANVVYLSSSEHRPSRHISSYMSRKNVGYLYAIRKGARFIYDTDQENELLVDINEHFVFSSIDYGLIHYDESGCEKSATTTATTLTTSVLNPYAHFGQPLIWPRGLPLNSSKRTFRNQYVLGKRRVSVVQQAVLNGDPDVDASFRLSASSRNNKRRRSLSFDATAPSLQLPQYRMAPFNAKSTLFHYDAFWALYLPHTVAMRLADIWRAYWAQRLMWLLDNATVAFVRAAAFRSRSSSVAQSRMDNNNDADDDDDLRHEQAMHEQTQQLVDMLYEWRCTQRRFYACVLELSALMAQRNFWASEEVGRIELWLADLAAVGYQEPTIANHEHQIETSMSEHIVGKACERDAARLQQLDALTNRSAYSLVRYTPIFQRSINTESYCCPEFPSVDVNDETKAAEQQKMTSLAYLRQFCASSNYSLRINESRFRAAVSHDHATYDLLITFNREVSARNVITLHHMYALHFRRVIFCGRDFSHFDAKINWSRGKKQLDSFTFITLDTHIGYYHYACLTKAIELGLVNNGFFLLSDDVLFKYWEVERYHRLDRLIFAKRLVAGARLLQNTANWSWWQGPHGFRALHSLWQFFVSRSHLLDAQDNERIVRFRRVLDAHAPQHIRNKQIDMVSTGGSDFFYVPRDKYAAYHFLSRLFWKFGVFLELAVPTMLCGLDEENWAQTVNATYNNTGNRYLIFPKQYRIIGSLYHPAKLSGYYASKEGHQFCAYYLQDLIDNWI